MRNRGIVRGRLFFGYLILFAAVVCFATANAQTQTPAAAAQSFYRWYVAELNAEHDPITKRRAEIR